MSDTEIERAAPWIRLAGAILVGFALVQLVQHASIPLLLARAKQAGPDLGSGSLDRLDEAHLLIDLLSTASVGIAIAGGYTTALALTIAAWRSSQQRALVGLAALAFAAGTAYALHLLVVRFLVDGPDGPPSSRWYLFSAAASFVAWSAASTVVVLRARERRGRNVAFACVLVAATAALLQLYASPLVTATPPPWWKQALLGLRPSAWTPIVGALGLGLGLWLVSAPASEGHQRGFDRAAARGLRLARTAVWWRVGLAAGGTALMLAGAAAQRQAHQQQTILVGGSDPPSAGWMLDVASWLGLAEIVLGTVMVAGLGAAVLQCRSRHAAVLSGLGALLLLVTVMASFAMDRTLHDALRGNLPGLSQWGSIDARDYAKLVLEHDSTLRWLGLFGMGTTLAGLMVLVRDIGRGSSKRAIRFLALAVLFTSAWLWGREPLAGLGMGLLLLAPVILGAAVWMLLDLVTFLGEVADALEPESPSP